MDTIRPPGTLRAALWIARKELRTSFRDRNTLLYAVLVPLLLYPLLLWAGIQVVLLVQGRDERTAVQLGLASSHPERLAAVEGLERELEGDPDALTAGGERLNRVEVARGARAMDAEEARAWAVAPADPAGRALDAVLWLPAAGAAAPSGSSALRESESAQLFFDGTRGDSKLARKRVEKRLERFARDLREDAVRSSGGSPEDLVPFALQEVNIAPKRDMLAYLLSFLLPMLLVAMCVLGAFFPAVDLTAGEKERRTEETTLLLPVSRTAVHQGKILAVCAAALLATALNLLALAFSAGHLLSILDAQFLDSAAQIPLAALAAVAPLALLFAFFVAAVLTGIASLASTFKEGQALLGPVQLVFILPAMVGVVPGVELTMATACIPVVNVVLAFRGLLQGRVLPAEYALTALSLCLAALIAIRAAVWMLSREVLADSGRPLSLASLRRLFASRRRSA